MARLARKIALVTGCAKERGFGRGAARRLADEGAAVVLTDILEQGTSDGNAKPAQGWKGLASVAEEISEAGGQVMTATLDVGSASQVEAVFAEVREKFGGIDIVMNNAAAPIGEDRVPVTQVSEAAWDLVIDTNLKGTFLCSKAAAALMIEQKRGGRIINVSSDLGKIGLANRAAYCASKFGIIGFTQALAMELAPLGITVNSICPGSGVTNRLHYLGRRSDGTYDPQLRNEMISEKSTSIPLGRLVTPEDVGDLVAFLASDQGGYITGQAINLSGGLVMH